MKKFFTALIFILIIELVGAIGSLVTYPAIRTWYAIINKPSFNPPNWVFGPVWTTLFALMGLSLYLVWQKGTREKTIRAAIYIFVIQMVLNVLWSFLFFGLQKPYLAFIEIVILWFAILATIIKFYKVSKLAAYLLIPYFFWVSFAAFLNFMIAKIN